MKCYLEIGKDLVRVKLSINDDETVLVHELRTNIYISMRNITIDELVKKCNGVYYKSLEDFRAMNGQDLMTWWQNQPA